MTGNQLRDAIKEAGITQDKASYMLGVTRRTLQNWFNLDKLDANTMQNVKENLGISLDDEKSISLKKSVTHYGGENEECDESYKVPVLPLSAQGGSLTDFLVSVQYGDCEYIVSPIKDADFSISVTGDSMAPEYPSGSEILIKKIDEKAFIDWGKAYVLDTVNGAVVKKIFPSEDDEKIRCVSINPDYPPFEVCYKDIFGFYRILLLMARK